LMQCFHKHGHAVPDLPVELFDLLESAVRPLLEAYCLLQLARREQQGQQQGQQQQQQQQQEGDQHNPQSSSSSGSSSPASAGSPLDSDEVEQLLAVLVPVVSLLLAADSKAAASVIVGQCVGFLEAARAAVATAADAAGMYDKAVAAASTVLQDQTFLQTLKAAPLDNQDMTLVSKAAMSGPCTFSMRLGHQAIAGFVGTRMSLVLSGLRGVGSKAVKDLEALPGLHDAFDFSSAFTAHSLQHSGAAVMPFDGSMPRGLSPSIKGGTIADSLLVGATHIMMSLVARVLDSRLPSDSLQRALERPGGLVAATDSETISRLPVVASCLAEVPPLSEADATALLTPPPGALPSESALGRSM
jgi:hypothetical protein